MRCPSSASMSPQRKDRFDNSPSLIGTSGSFAPAPRPSRRIASAPPAVLLNCVDWEREPNDLQLPATADVQRYVEIGGPSTTLKDVAISIVKRLLENPDNDPDEVLFLSDCLKAGPSRTAVPCGLLRGAAGRGGVFSGAGSRDPSGNGSEDMVQRYLLRTYGSGDDTPTSTISHAALSARSFATISRKASRHLSLARSASDLPEDSARHPSFALSECNQADDSVRRWPGHLAVSEKQQLEALMEAQFPNWGLDVFEVARLTGNRPLRFVGWESLRRGCFFSEFEIDAEKALNFLTSVESSYMSSEQVPYHNSLHAADVTHTVFSLLWKVGFIEYFEPPALLALVLSAVVHDMGHDGRNNQFHTNMKDDLALTYNDRSVLENFHVAQAFKLMSRDASANILDVCDAEKFKSIRKDMIENVLGTDMAHHFRQIDCLKNQVDRLDRDPADWTEPAAVSILQATVLHAADIGNLGKPVDLSDKWVTLLKREFFMQGDEERDLGLPISPLCDREVKRFAGPQVGFINFIVKPTFDVLALLMTGVEDIILKELMENLEVWEARKTTEEKELQAEEEREKEKEKDKDKDKDAGDKKK